MRVQHYDKGTLSPAKRRDNGTVVAEAHLTRSGVFTYAKPGGGITREYRPDTEVFSPASLESFNLVPVTDDHPPELLTAANAAQYSVGTTGNDVRADDDHVIGSVAIHDAKMIAKMDAGKLQVSCGYECDLDETPGIAPDGTRYDAVQRNIRGNHLAIVQRGRADSARLRMDAEFMTDDETAPSAQRNDSMDLKEALVALAAANEKLGAEKARADAATTVGASHKSNLDAVTARLDSLTEELKNEKKARTDAASATPSLVRARVELETKSGPILGAAVKLDALDDRAIHLAVIKQVTGADVAADKSNDYVAARFDAAVERVGASTAVMQGAMSVINQGRADASLAESPAEKARIARDNENATLNQTHRAEVLAGHVSKVS
ncbi:MAG: DUF2213 domain-containing protein [Actinobacteria bacterium]|nr:DUF2213 domain-containing protein [Actinomycetota bacterium]